MAENDFEKMMKGDDAFTQKTPPSAAFIAWFVAQADTQSPKSPFHRLGSENFDASPGDHTHDGRNSRLIFNPASDIITGDLSTLAGLQSAVGVIAGLLARLGATDSTTN